MSIQLREMLGFNEFQYISKELLRFTAGSGEETSTCCASGTRD